MSVANQKSLTINKSKTITPPFVQVSETDWHLAAKELTYTEFIVWLYLAQNKAGYCIEYSPQAIANLGLMSKGQASKVRASLEEKGYIIGDQFYVRAPKNEVGAKEIMEKEHFNESDF